MQWLKAESVDLSPGVGSREESGVGREAPGDEIPVLRGLIAEAAHLDRDQLGELATQVLDVDARAAIDVGGEFVGEKQRFHSGLPGLWVHCGRDYTQLIREGRRWRWPRGEIGRSAG